MALNLYKFDSNTFFRKIAHFEFQLKQVMNFFYFDFHSKHILVKDFVIILIQITDLMVRSWF